MELNVLLKKLDIDTIPVISRNTDETEQDFAKSIKTIIVGFPRKSKDLRKTRDFALQSRRYSRKNTDSF